MHKPRRIIYPPIWLLFGFAAMFTIDYFFPFTSRFAPVVRYAAAVPVLLGLAIIISAGSGFRKAGTDMVPFKNVNSLVTDGIYRFTRNPMYLGMAIILLGAAMLFANPATLLTVPVFMAIIQARFIIPEERMLSDLFGAEFETYCSRVRRWL